MSWDITALTSGASGAGRAQPEQVPVKPDEGLEVVSRARGIAMSEAHPLLSMYNITILSTDFSAARPTAQKVSTPGGDLPDVQTLSLFQLSW